MTVPVDPATLERLAEASGSGPLPGGAGEEALSRGRLVLRRFRRRKLAMAGLAVLGLLFVAAFVSPVFYRWGYADRDFDAFLQSPSASHWFGTTQIGGDVFAATMRGLQKSLIIGLLTAFVSTFLAAVVGASAGYYGGRVDRALMWFVDLLLVMPSFLIIAILSPTFKGKTWLLFVVLLAGFSWMITARIVRSLTLSLKEREFIQAARFMGVPTRTIIFRHLLPNMSSFLIIDATLAVGGAILAETGLSYFGFGVQPPDVSLGTVIASATGAALPFPWQFVPAGVVLILTVLAVSAVGDGLRDALDPTSAAARAK